MWTYFATVKISSTVKRNGLHILPGILIWSISLLAFIVLPGQVFSQPLVSVAALSAPAADRTVLSEVETLDAFIKEVFSTVDVDRYDLAVEAYLTLLSKITESLARADASIVDRHLRMMAMIMPAADRSAIGLGEVTDSTLVDRLKPGAWEEIRKWWRRQDDLPASESNERLEEHLKRGVHAVSQFAHRTDVRGVDDRGEVYIRLGAPSHHTEVKIRDTRLQTRLAGVTMPENEFWVYRHIDYDAHFIFVQRKRVSGYQLGQPQDLIPNRLRGSRRNAGFLLAWMEEVYQQLALYHNVYGPRYDDVANYRALRSPSDGSPFNHATRILMRSAAEDEQMQWQKHETVPTSFSTTWGLAEHLPVLMRWARFLDPDGSTRTEIYWAIEGKELKPSRKLRRRLKKEGFLPTLDYLLTVSLAHQDRDHQNRSFAQDHFLVGTDEKGNLPPRMLTVRGDTAAYNLALQWDEHWAETSEERLTKTALLKLGTYRIDTLRALHADGFQLEMSDIKPLLMENGFSPDAAQPYPFTRLNAETPLGLYFEVYNLSYGADDQTHYSVSYDVLRQEASGLLSLKPPSDRTVTSAKTSYSGEERTAREFIIPDLQAWDAKGNITIRLNVTDETTGQTAVRMIEFVVSN